MNTKPLSARRRHLFYGAAMCFVMSVPLMGQTAFNYVMESPSGHTAVIDHESLNGKPNQIVMITPDFGTLGPYNPSSLGVYYVQGQWRLFNQDRAAIPDNLHVNVLVVPPSESAFVHTASAENITRNVTQLDHPKLNGNPNARPLITQRWEGVYNDHPIGIYYSSDGIWRIFNQDLAAMPENAKFNVILDDRATLVEAAAPVGNWTAIDHASTNNHPDRVVLVSQHWAGFYNRHDVGVWYSQGEWRILNEDRAAMTRGVKFHVLSVDEGSFDNGPVERKPLYGMIDMHTHPVAQYGFGEELFHGGNDGDPHIALGSCNCIHNFVLPVDEAFCDQMNAFRNAMVDDLDPHTKEAGYPHFRSWPRHDSVLHQLMWYEWIRRAKDGGLRVMVALAVSNHCIADGAETSGYNDDLRSMNLQIQKLKEFIGRHHDFMEIAYTSNDLDRIVRSGRLAVILGSEMDNIGNFYDPVDKKGGVYNPIPSEAEMRAEIDRLYDLGVRYMFPVHVTNNVFGGAAIYQTEFNVANKYNTGSPFLPEVVDARTTGITYKMLSPYAEFPLVGTFLMNFTGTVIPGHVMPNNPDNYPFYADPGIRGGHRNSLGLTDRGRYAVDYMMKRGMMVDIDHMSEKAVADTMNIAFRNDYPLNSGHNQLRGDDGTENDRTVDQLRNIRALGGVFGVGHGDGAGQFVEQFRAASEIMGNRQVAFGSDVNGLYPLPGPPPGDERISYGSNLTKCVTGTKTWDFNEEGFAHYGLLPDYVESMRSAGMTQAEHDRLFSGAEYFCQMWAKCERRAYDMSRPQRTVHLSPSVGVLCLNELVRGDRDFGGNGPRIQSTVRLQLNEGKTRLHAVIDFNARETGGDRSETRGTWVNELYTAPAGMKIAGILTSTESSVDFVSRAAGFEIGGCGDGEVHTPSITGGLVSQMEIIGDTGGADISSDDDCSCDTQIRSIDFNRIQLALTPMESLHEAIPAPAEGELALEFLNAGSKSLRLRLTGGEANTLYRLEFSQNLREWQTIESGLNAAEVIQINRPEEEGYVRVRAMRIERLEAMEAAR